MRHRYTGSLGILFTALLAVTVPVQAQQGSISGQVTDQDTGQLLTQAQIQVLGGGTSDGTLSDAQGNFTLSMAPGSYSIVAVLLGYETERIDGISVSAGAAAEIDIAMTSTALALDPVTVTVSRGQEERTLAAPAHVSVITADQIAQIAATSVADYVKTMPGVDVAKTGINQSNTVTRGFNNVFSGSLLVLTDHRYARLPSLRLNNYNLLPTTSLDIERIEVVLGPAAALYGPNSANGVMHIITTSPIDRPGSTMSLSGGNRGMAQGTFRQAWAFSDKVGLKVSGTYFRGNDFEYTDPVEAAAAAAAPGTIIGDRDYFSSHYGGEARLDIRPWDDSSDNIIVTGGLKTLASSIEPTGIGAGQAKNWTYRFAQARLNKGGLFAQAFLNQSMAGDTYMLRTGNPIVDNSVTFAWQAQYNFDITERFNATAGFDYTDITPKTGGTITGANEASDETKLKGGYLHTTTTLTDQLDFVAALRMDTHEHLEDVMYSPRLGLVLTPEEGHSFRAMFNRSFGTPTTNGLFLDILAGRIPITANVFYNLQANGIPLTGFTFNNTCAGGINNYCMYSAFAPGVQLPATGAALWDALIVPLALQNPTLLATLPLLGLNAAMFAAIVGNPQPGELKSNLMDFNSQNPSIPFIPSAGPQATARLRPTMNTSFELGYTGLIGDKVRLSVSAYQNQYKDFTGPLRVTTPNVFLDGNSVATYLITRLTAAGIPASVASQLAAAIAPTAASVPLGTIVPDQRSNSDLIMNVRNYGKFSIMGVDVGMEAHLSNKVTLTGSYSRVNKECYDYDNDGTCLSRNDVALNAPTNKGSVGLNIDDKVSGLFFGGLLRMSGGYPMNSGVYQGVIDAFNVVDVSAGYRVPGYKGLTISTTINNLLNNKHREFIGVPEMGLLALLKVQFEF